MLHAIIGVLIYFNEILATVYFLLTVFYFMHKILKSTKKYRTIEILKACAYIVGVEVFLRMNGGTVFYEASKYVVIVFIIMGLISNSFKNQALIYVVYLLLLIPGIFVAVTEMGFETNIRREIAFNLSGPVCLGISAIFCYKRSISFKQLKIVLLAFLFPLISMLVYLFLYTPDLESVITSTESNFATSGGFGPNQVATVLGIGIFVLTVKFFMYKTSFWMRLLDLVLLGLFTFRAIITFSRGGVITAIIMIICFVALYYWKVNFKTKLRLKKYLLIFLGLMLFTWIFSSIQTGGFIDKRYANEDAAGREKEDITTGRTDLIAFEFNEFINHPFLGIGVGKVKEERLVETGVEAASHSEMSRIVAEHGLLGVFAFLILLITPLVFRLHNKSNLLFYSFYLFWLLTINHSAMRIAAPGFIYALCLLNITYKKPQNKVNKTILSG